MKIVLSAIEARVVGCLLEKQLTTPEQYPMSLNGVVVACNQKTNREPVLALSESEVLDTLKVLEKKHLVTAQSGFGQRVVKYEHRFCNTEFGELKLNEGEFALVTTLLLRGPQTPGELRSRSQRLHDFDDMARVEQTLELLAARLLVVRLTREPGKRESRYMHLFSGDVSDAMNDAMSGVEPVSDPQGLAARVTVLEREMAELRQQLAELSGKSS